MPCKLDVEKTCDHSNWDFLLCVVQTCGFGERWMKWVEFYISTVKFFILVNGTATGIFASSRGVQQGVPLFTFPLLFVIVMVALGRIRGVCGAVRF